VDVSGSSLAVFRAGQKLLIREHVRYWPLSVTVLGEQMSAFGGKADTQLFLMVAVRRGSRLP